MSGQPRIREESGPRQETKNEEASHWREGGGVQCVDLTLSFPIEPGQPAPVLGDDVGMDISGLDGHLSPQFSHRAMMEMSSERRVWLGDRLPLPRASEPLYSN